MKSTIRIVVACISVAILIALTPPPPKVKHVPTIATTDYLPFGGWANAEFALSETGPGAAALLDFDLEHIQTMPLVLSGWIPEDFSPAGSVIWLQVKASVDDSIAFSFHNEQGDLLAPVSTVWASTEWKFIGFKMPSTINWHTEKVYITAYLNGVNGGWVWVRGPYERD